MKIVSMKKVMITMDYNPTAQKIAEIGSSFAKSMGAKITLIHVISTPVNYISTGYSPIMGFEGFNESMIMKVDNSAEIKKATQNFLDKAKKHLEDESIVTVIKEGPLAESILKAADEENIDVIVMGSHSRKWLESILMGSVTEEVLQKTTIPILIIPTKKTRIT
jgi:nucleotide-binding universal stress UspA family protein